MMDLVQAELKRFLLFLAAMAAMMLYAPIREYLYWTYKSPFYTHVLLIPLVSAYISFTRRKVIIAKVGYAFLQGGAVVSMGLLLLAAAATTSGWSDNDHHALVAFAAVLTVVGVVVAVFGPRACWEARFSVLFLVFMIPLPTLMEYWVIRLLQYGSAEFVSILFMLTGVPVFRDGTLFHLPGISIEVAPQCSGIRSSMALVITTMLAGHMFLKSTWRKSALVLSAIPVTMFKNGIRIVSLSLLGVYVDKGILESSLHRDGGILFFVLALLLMAPFLFLLRKTERTRGAE